MADSPQDTTDVLINKCNSDAVLPVKLTVESPGYDIVLLSKKHNFGEDTARFSTGLRLSSFNIVYWTVHDTKELMEQGFSLARTHTIANDDHSEIVVDLKRMSSNISWEKATGVVLKLVPMMFVSLVKPFVEASDEDFEAAIAPVSVEESKSVSISEVVDVAPEPADSESESDDDSDEVVEIGGKKPSTEDMLRSMAESFTGKKIPPSEEIMKNINSEDPMKSMLYVLDQMAEITGKEDTKEKMNKIKQVFAEQLTEDV